MGSQNICFQREVKYQYFLAEKKPPKNNSIFPGAMHKYLFCFLFCFLLVIKLLADSRQSLRKHAYSNI